jgi:hypothetical protein
MEQQLVRSIFKIFSYRALGLREILKAHGSGYGRILGQSLQVNHSRNQRMLEDLAVRLVRECVSIDISRFAFFAWTILLILWVI